MAKDYTQIDEDFLSEVIEREIADADSWMSADLQQEQADNLKYYYGEPFGNEEDGFSKVVTRDVLETVEGILPDLMKIFTSGDEVVEFLPQTPQDVDAAELAGRYLSHLFMNREQGYKILYDWFKDGLLMKNGIIQVEWESCEDVQFKEYHGLTEEEWKTLEDNQENETDIGFYEIDGFIKNEEDGEVTYDARVKTTRMVGKPDIQVIPSEDFLIKERSTSIKDTVFCAHRQELTVGEVIEMGYDEDDVLGAVRISRAQEEPVEGARFKNPDESGVVTEVAGSKYDAIVEFSNAYIRLYDPEDERVKLYHTHHLSHKCLMYEEVDRIPFISLSPIMIPHKYNGLAVADLVRDIQEIRSTIYRQILDNLALQNAGRYTAVEGQVNLQDLIDNKIGGIVRQKVAGAVGRLDTPDLSQATMPMLQLLDTQKEDRTGVSRMTHGLDSNAAG
jgi:hypothetical protein